MKKFAFAFVALCVGAVVAEDNSLPSDSSSYGEFGILPVYSTATQTIISIPWVQTGVSAGEIMVADVVKTDNLSVGDELYYYNTTSKKYETWRLVAGTGTSAPTWESVTTVSSSSGAGFEISSSNAADDRKLNRGDALILVRQSPTDSSGNAKPFYLYGQAATTAASATTLAAGSSGTPAYTLVSPPVATDFNVNSATWSDVDGGAYLYYTGTNGFPYTIIRNNSNSKWVGRFGGGSFSESKAIIPAGVGAWYINEGSSATVTWPAP